MNGKFLFRCIFVLFIVMAVISLAGCGEKGNDSAEKKADSASTEKTRSIDWDKVSGQSSDKAPAPQPRIEEPKEPAKPVEPEPAAEPNEPEVKPIRVKLETNKGDIILELNQKAAPVTVKNFLQYVEDGFYDGTIFHRVIKGFMIQGGGLTPDMQKKATRPPIINEANNGLKNDRGTIAMARTQNPHSATSQFFINHRDNTSLNYVDISNPGYTVFGKVVEGINVVDAIAAVRTTYKAGRADVPVETIILNSAKVITDE